ncbi:hypothetical protein HF086_006412 [Spodoptera exigua]|uniref:Uncharacterized protein n=1 Tax=Spodoptera exigua TaxID=7107 RepID=A0A922MX15_SPOEX|nr:hypothetical protein HF086_006412 [Spodoptera exigua]
MFKAYIQIHECYNSFKNIFQAGTFIKTAESLFHELVNNQILIDFFKYVYSVRDPHFMQALLFAWVLKNLSIITTLSLFLEQYYVLTEMTQDSCFTILATDCTDPYRLKTTQPCSKKEHRPEVQEGLYADLNNRKLLMCKLLLNKIVLFSDEERKMCKNVLRLHRASFHKMSVFRLFVVDICHPMRLIVLLTNYTIVLLQLAFL